MNNGAEWLHKDIERRGIKFEYLDILPYVNEESEEINVECLEPKIRSFNPQIAILMICYSQILTLKLLLEKEGLFAEMRINRDLNILSNGQILTMNVVQKEFIQTMTLEDHVEKDVIVTGPVGSGKTLLGLEAINIKKSHYKKKCGISSNDCKYKLRIIILIGERSDESQLKQQLEMSESHKDCTLDIITELCPDSTKLTRIFQSNENYKHTIIMMDEITR